MAFINEGRNLLLHSVKPIFFGRVIFFLFQRFFYSFQYRYFPARWYYPKEVQSVYKSAILTLWQKIATPRLVFGARNDSITGGRLKLAVGFFEYEGAPDWRQEFIDPEQTMSLHRWGWLIYDEMEAEQGLMLMHSWLSVMGSVPEGVAGTSYTTSERIVNALLFCRQKKIAVPEDLRVALLTMAFHLVKHIEYHGIRGTGNHVINNARALFFAGQIFEIKELSDLACAIIKDALPWLITKDGFLREESSHYHLLFTRWILEMHELAEETNHREMANYLKLYGHLLTERCQFFLVKSENNKWQIPLIGDISPDCTPEWLIEYWEGKKGDSPPLVGGVGGGGAVMQAFSESGWFRLDRGGLTIFWHVPQENMIHRATHGHADLCSFVLFHKGKPIIIDPGRLTYKSDEGCLAHDHNALTVDGFDPFLYDRAQKFPASYQRRDVQCKWQEQGGSFIFFIAHAGFRRLAGDRIKHTRRFRVTDEFLEIEDELRGKQEHTVEAFFHFATETHVKLEVEGWTPLEAGRLKATVRASKETLPLMGWTSPAYGVKINSPLSVVASPVSLPAKIFYRVSLSR